VRVKFYKLCNKVTRKTTNNSFSFELMYIFTFIQMKKCNLVTKYEGYGKGVIEKFISMEE